MNEPLEYGGFQAWLRRIVGKGKEILSSKLEYIIRLPEQQELQEVRYEGTDLWMLSQIRGMICLQFLLFNR